MSAERIEESPFAPGDTYQGMPVPVKPMTVIERASKALSKEEVEKRIKELVTQSKPIIAVTDAEGREVCHEALMVLRNMRTQTQRQAKVGRDEAVQYSKAVIAIEKELVALIEPEETRLAKIRDEWDAKLAAEKQAKIDAEIARITEIQQRMDGIRNWPINAANQPSMLVGQMLAQARTYRIEPEIFEEHAEAAANVLAVSIAALAGILQQRKTFEAEQLQAEEDRKELARLKAEETERQRVAAEERRRQEAEDKAKRDTEAAAQAEANRIERARIAQEEADAKAVRDTEARRLVAERLENERIARERQEALDRQAEEQRQANAAEVGRIAAERAQFDRDRAAAAEVQRKANEPKQEPVKAMRHVERPTAAQIVACVAEKWGVSPEMATSWITKAKIELQQAAA